MYAVAWHNSNGGDADVYPNIFPDLDMACDCVIYEIGHRFEVKLSNLEFDVDVGGKKIVYYENMTFVIRKLFNFNPKGL